MPTKVTRAPRRTKSFWIKHINQWRISGQSKSDYCRKHGLNVGSFYNWCSIESTLGSVAKKKRAPATPLKLVPVTVADADSDGRSASSVQAATVTLQSNAGRFSFPANLCAEAIDRWLRVISHSHV